MDEITKEVQALATYLPHYTDEQLAQSLAETMGVDEQEALDAVVFYKANYHAICE